jgi:hypothetical protein
VDEIPRLDREVRADVFDHARQFVLNNESRSLRVLDNEPDLGADQAKIDRNGDEARLGCRRVDLDPLDAVVGENGDTIAFR